LTSNAGVVINTNTLTTHANTMSTAINSAVKRLRAIATSELRRAIANTILTNTIVDAGTVIRTRHCDRLLTLITNVTNIANTLAKLTHTMFRAICAAARGKHTSQHNLFAQATSPTLITLATAIISTDTTTIANSAITLRANHLNFISVHAETID